MRTRIDGTNTSDRELRIRFDHSVNVPGIDAVRDDGSWAPIV